MPLDPLDDPFEDAYEALFAAVSAGVTPFVTKSRRWTVWDSVQDQPAIFQVQKGETVSTNATGLPEKYKLRAQIWIYAKSQNAPGDPAPSTVLNPLITVVKQALVPTPFGAKQSLGGLVEHAYVDGEIKIWEGALADQAIAMIPVTMLMSDPLQ